MIRTKNKWIDISVHLFLIHIDIICIFEISCVYPTRQLAILCGKNFNNGHNLQTTSPNSFIPAMLIGTIDVYHFVSLLVVLTFAEGHKVSRKQDLLA